MCLKSFSFQTKGNPNMNLVFMYSTMDVWGTKVWIQVVRWGLNGKMGGWKVVENLSWDWDLNNDLGSVVLICDYLIGI
jgi:hypothetical protein